MTTLLKPGSPLKMSIPTLKTLTLTLKIIFYLRTPAVKYQFYDLECLFQWFKVCQIKNLKCLFQGPKCPIQL